MRSRWILAFDASCCECTNIAHEVVKHGVDRIEVMPLDHPDVVAWRHRALGDEPPFAPTLISVDGDDRPKAWLGLASGVRLTALLGPMATWRLARALARTRRKAADHRRAAHPEAKGMDRKELIRLGGLGMVAAILVGRTAPASAAAGRRVEAPELTAAREWAKANHDRLPQTYREFVTYDATRRKAIYAELPPHRRSRLWVEQLTGFRTGSAGFTVEQRTVLDAGLALAADPATFRDEEPTGERHERLEKLRVAAIDAFGLDRARTMFTNLGAAGGATLLAPDHFCGCSCFSDWCWGSDCVCCAACAQCCYCITLACGTLDSYTCRGDCV